MKHYKSSTGAVYAFESEEDRLQYGSADLVPMSMQDLDAHLAPAPEPAPQVVTRFQALAALHMAGLLEAVEAAMADAGTDPLYRLAWTAAQEFRRQSPAVLSMASALGLGEQQLDALFTAAAGIEA